MGLTDLVFKSRIFFYIHWHNESQGLFTDSNFSRINSEGKKGYTTSFEECGVTVTGSGGRL